MTHTGIAEECQNAEVPNPKTAVEPLYDIAAHDPWADTSRWMLVQGSDVVVSLDEDGGAHPLTATQAQALGDAVGTHHVLGRVDGNVYWTAELDPDVEPPGGMQARNLRTLFGKLTDLEWNIGGRATQIVDWERDNRFCGRCAGPMERSGKERSLKCPADGLLAYPRLSPAVIMLITRSDTGQALLGRSALWSVPMFSTLAGFVEPGETLEETVHREVREEVGVEVTNVSYFGSQAWPFPNSLMLGFTAEWESGDIVIDPEEIAEARWFDRDDLPMIPPGQSIARMLIDSWVNA